MSMRTLTRILLADINRRASQRPAGYVEDVLSHGTINGEWLEIEDTALTALREKYQSELPTNGPGTELKKLIGYFGLTAGTNCSCDAHVAEMNQRGPAWCEANMETILGWLRTESARRALPFAEWAARIMVKAAIRRARITNAGRLHKV